MFNFLQTILLASVVSVFGADRSYLNTYFHDLDSVPFVLIDKQNFTLSLIDSAGHVTDSYNDIGIHGTHLPGSIGSRCTEGCIRMKNEE